MAQEQQKEEERQVRTEPTTAEPSASRLTKAPTRELESSRERSMERTALSAFRRFMDDMFSGFGFGGGLSPMELLGAAVWSPVIETIQKGDRLVFRVDLPGLGEEDVNVEIVGDELVISGERKQERQETKGGRFYSERRYGSFERRIVLPEGLDPESVEAKFDNGVLEVSVPLPERATTRSKKIDIKGAPREKEKEKEESDKVVESIH
jgi:HSP20 family protein